MTATTIKTAKPRKQGRVARKVAHKKRAAARAVAPYAATVGTSLVAGAALHETGLWWMGAGATGATALIRLHETHGWHRGGGKAAARKRRKFQGTATKQEIKAQLSLSAVQRRARVTRPSLAGIHGLAAEEAGVLIGMSVKPSREIYGTAEDFYAIFGPQRSGKSGWMAGAAADAPGACLVASTRVDMWANTSIARGERGPVLTLNPGGEGGIPSTFGWNPVAGCEVPSAAIQRAGYMMDAAPKDSSGKDAWWDAQGAVLLRLMLHAAALTRAPVTTVQDWIADPGNPIPLDILTRHPYAAPGWANELAAMLAHDGEYLQNVSKGAVTALNWLSDPAMAALACPSGSWDGFDAEAFIRDGGTIYLVGTDRPHNSLAPYFATLAAHLFDTAKQIAANSPGSRCDPPLTLVIDEPAITCPVPLDRWSAEAGGHGVTLITGFQSRSQMSQRWGEHGAETIWNNATVKLIYGGFTHAADLEAFSAICGEVDTWDHSKGPGGEKTKSPRQQRLFPPERIRLLPEGRALILHRRTRPLVAQITPVWERPGYQRADAFGSPAFTPGPQTAIDVTPQREAIPMPGAPATSDAAVSSLVLSQPNGR